MKIVEMIIEKIIELHFKHNVYFGNRLQSSSVFSTLTGKSASVWEEETKNWIIAELESLGYKTQEHSILGIKMTNYGPYKRLDGVPITIREDERSLNFIDLFSEGEVDAPR